MFTYWRVDVSFVINRLLIVWLVWVIKLLICRWSTWVRCDYGWLDLCVEYMCSLCAENCVCGDRGDRKDIPLYLHPAVPPLEPLAHVHRVYLAHFLSQLQPGTRTRTILEKCLNFWDKSCSCDQIYILFQFTECILNTQRGINMWDEAEIWKCLKPQCGTFQVHSIAL